MQTKQEVIPHWSNVNQFIQHFKELGVTEQQAAYIYIGEKKNHVLDKINKGELEGQKILLGLKKRIEEVNVSSSLDSKDIAEIENGLKVYKKLVEDLDETVRKPFTDLIKAKVTEPVMSPIRDRLKPEINADFKEISDNLIKLKKRFAEVKQVDTEKQQEAQRYAAHIKNENIAIIAEYKSSAMQLVNDTYKNLLEAKIPANNVEVSVLKEQLAKIKFRDPIKFKRSLITIAEASAIIKNVQAENNTTTFEDVQRWAFDYTNERFSMYQNDLDQVLRNEDFVEVVSKHNEEDVKQIKEDAELQKTVNEFVSTAEVVPEVVQEHKNIKERWKVVNENTESWHVNVIAAYLRTHNIRKYLKNTKNRIWANICVDTMADLLGLHATDTGNFLETLKYEKIEKL